MNYQLAVAQAIEESRTTGNLTLLYAPRQFYSSILMEFYLSATYVFQCGTQQAALFKKPGEWEVKVMLSE